MKRILAGMLALWFSCTFSAPANAQRYEAHGDTTDYLVKVNGVDSLVYRQIDLRHTQADSLVLWSVERPGDRRIGSFQVNAATRVWQERILWRKYLCVGYVQNVIEEIRPDRRTRQYEGTWVRTFRIRVRTSKCEWFNPKTKQSTPFVLTEPTSVAPYLYPR